MTDAEAVELLRKRLKDHPAGGGPVMVDEGFLLAVLRRHDHYRDEFTQHSGGDGMDCDCVELSDKFARGEIE